MQGNVLYINRHDFLAKEPLTLLQFGYFIEPEKVKEAFAKEGYIIHSEKDLIPLSEAIRTSGDQKGALRDSFNKRIFFDGKKVLGEMPITLIGKEKIKSGQIQFIA